MCVCVVIYVSVATHMYMNMYGIGRVTRATLMAEWSDVLSSTLSAQIAFVALLQHKVKDFSFI